MGLGDLIPSLAQDPASNGLQMSPQELQRRQAIVDALTKEGSSYAPVQSWTQGAARLAQALSGVVQRNRLDAMQNQYRNQTAKDSSALMAALFGGQQPAAQSASSPEPGGASTPIGSSVSDMLPTFAKVGGGFGISPEYLAKTAQIESAGNPNAHNPSGADGLFQFMPATAQQYGLSDTRDPMASTVAAARLASDNRNALAKALGRDPTDAELYLAHQQGAGGAAKLLANPDAPAASIVGAKAVTQNGGTPNMSAGDFANIWLKKFANVSVPGGSAQSTAGMAFAGSQPTLQDQGSSEDQETPAKAAAVPPSPPQVQAAAQQSSGPSPQVAAAMRVLQNPYATPQMQQIAGLIIQKAIPAQQQFSAPYKDADGNLLQRKPDGQVVMLAKGSEKPSAQKPFVMGEDQYGRKIYGQLDQSGKPVPIEQPQAAQQQSSPDAMNLHGEEFMGTLDPQIAGQVRAIVEGRAPYPTGMLLKTPYGQKLAAYVTQADPSFEAGNPTARAKFLSDYSTGTVGKNNNALNTAIGHLLHLSDAAQNLTAGEWQGGQYPALNSIQNAMRTARGESSVTNFKNIVSQVAPEIVKVYRGSGGAEADIDRILKNIDASGSPKQINDAIGDLADLLKSKIEANSEQYRKVMGPLSKVPSMISDKAIAAMALLNNRRSDAVIHAASPTPSSGVKRYRYDPNGNLVAQ